MISLDIKKATLRQGLASVSNGLGALSVSLAMAYTSPALPSMINDPDLEISQDESSWIGSVVPAAALLGSLLSGHLIETMGRRKLTLSFIPPFIASWIIIALAPNIACVIAARILAGICVGIHTVAGSVYVSECVHVDLRAFMNVFPAILGTTGLLVVNFAGQFYEWRGVAWIACILGIPHLILNIMLPETPYFLLKNGKASEAKEVLAWLRDSKSEAELEIKELESLRHHKEESIKLVDLFKPPNRWPVCVAIFLHVFQQTTGINAVAFYSNNIFETADVPINPATSSVITMSTNVAANLICSYLVGIFNRKSLLRSSSLVVMASLVTMSIFLFAKESEGSMSTLASSLPMVPFLIILVYIASFSLGWGPVPFIFLGEGLPSKVRGPASALAISTNWIFAFVMTKTYFSLISAYGFSFVFLMYGFSTLLGMIAMEAYLPETMKRSTAEMDRFYEETYRKKEI